MDSSLFAQLLHPKTASPSLKTTQALSDSMDDICEHNCLTLAVGLNMGWQVSGADSSSGSILPPKKGKKTQTKPVLPIELDY